MDRYTSSDFCRKSTRALVHTDLSSDSTQQASSRSSTLTRMADHASLALSLLVLSIAATVWANALPSFQAEANPARRDFYGSANPEFFAAYLNDHDARMSREENSLDHVHETPRVRSPPSNGQAARNLRYLFHSDQSSPYSQTIALLPSDRELLERFVKRNIDEIDRTAFDNFFKRNLREIDRLGWSGFVKRTRANALSRRG